MGDLFLETMEHLEPALRADELEDCEKAVIDKISTVAPPQKNTSRSKICEYRRPI
jgi:hypothetical protein